jgi:poly(A) polymerase
VDGLILPSAEWRQREGMDRLVEVLGDARFVGGSVRDTLLGIPVSDVDLATPLPPQRVMELLRATDIKAVPTGMDHGTITAVLPSGPVEITTLRRDVSTDGRRASRR